jgi:hypothetical protein
MLVGGFKRSLRFFLKWPGMAIGPWSNLSIVLIGSVILMIARERRGLRVGDDSFDQHDLTGPPRLSNQGSRGP